MLLTNCASKGRGAKSLQWGSNSSTHSSCRSAMPQCSLLADFLMLCLGCWYIGVYVACSGKGRAFVGPGIGVGCTEGRVCRFRPRPSLWVVSPLDWHRHKPSYAQPGVRASLYHTTQGPDVENLNLARHKTKWPWQGRAGGVVHSWICFLFAHRVML